MKIAEMYHKFVGESPKRKTKIYLMMQLPMYSQMFLRFFTFFLL